MARSVNLDFFAAESDMRAVFDFVFASTDARVFESYSEYGADLREFRSTDELAAAFPLGSDPAGSGYVALLCLWSPTVMRKLTITRFALNPEACDGHTFRHRIDGGGLMHLHLGGVHGRLITKSNFGHQSEARARAWGTDDGVDWAALSPLSNRIRYHIRTRLAAGKAGSAAVLPRALALTRDGYTLQGIVQPPNEGGRSPEGKASG